MSKLRKQVAALPIAMDQDGGLRVLVTTSRETQRIIVPKGWPMKGTKDHKAAEIEALEEAGLVGKAHQKPIGSYLSWKRLEHTFELVRVKVFLLDVVRQLDTWKEKGQRQLAWLTPESAASLVDEPGLAILLVTIPHKLPKDWRTRASKAFVVKDAIG